METVWELCTDRKFHGWHVEAVDDVPRLFTHSSSKSKRVWLRDQCLWTKVFCDDIGSVYMGFMSPEEQDVNYLATRILIDLNQLETVATLRDTDNPLAYCVRGSALFYRVPHDTKTDIAVKGASPNEHRSIGLRNYPWDAFRANWPFFFRVTDAHMPYIYLEQSMPDDSDPINEWLSVMVRKNRAQIQKYAQLLNLNMTASTNYIIGAALLAIVLRRINRRAWEIIDLGLLLRNQKKRPEPTHARV